MRVRAVCAIAVVLLFAATACAGNVAGTPAVGANTAATASPTSDTTSSTDGTPAAHPTPWPAA